MRYSILNAICCSALLLLQLSSVPAEAEIYKWVDSEGRTHYTDEPPPDKGSKVELDVQRPSATPDEGEIRRRKLLEMAQREAEHKSAVEKELPPAEPRPQERYMPRCIKARHRWYALTQDIPIYWADDGTIRAAWHGDTYKGARNYIADDERPDILRPALQEIKTYCPNGEIDDEEGSGYAEWLRIEDCLVSRSRLEVATNGRSRTTKSELKNIRDEVRNNCS